MSNLQRLRITVSTVIGIIWESYEITGFMKAIMIMIIILLIYNDDNDDDDDD